MDALSGFVPATGTVCLDGLRLDALAPHDRVRAGLGRAFQGMDLYDDLSVGENVAVGLRGRRNETTAVAAVLDDLGLGRVLIGRRRDAELEHIVDLVHG